MKWAIYFICFISIILCQSRTFGKDRIIKDDKESHEIKKIILECILEDSETSKDLKEYADESLKNKDKKQILHFEKYRNNENDSDIIKQCRKKAFFKKLSIKPIIRNNETAF